MSNSQGSYRSTIENSMAAFDKLPSSARAALANAAFQWAPQPFVTGFEKRNLWKNGKELAAFIAKLDCIELGKHAYRTYGADHPQAERPARKQARRKRS